jgi:hypothetical protein
MDGVRAVPGGRSASVVEQRAKLGFVRPWRLRICVGLNYAPALQPSFYLRGVSGSELVRGNKPTAYQIRSEGGLVYKLMVLNSSFENISGTTEITEF